MVPTSSYKIDRKKAEDITIRFLQQHYNVINVKKISNENNVWVVRADVSSFGEATREVSINAKTGKIISWQ
ncbi:MAG: hypothetical protein E6L02_07520 [Thaumarchaeota archaeon]|nr:MAG: hypothetical protein E6L02_07520 [Nitrososphaerota archaeon]